MRPAFLIAPLLWICAAVGAQADARMTVLTDVLRMSEATAILSAEGMQSAEDLNDEMLQGQGGPGFQQQVAKIYDPQRMGEVVRAALADALDPDAREAVIEFYNTPLGDKVITLENSARKAISDPDIEEAARARFAALEGSDDPRLAQIEQLIEGGDMVSRNVTSAMNSNLQFLRGLADGRAIEMSQEDMLADIAGDIEATTEDTASWLYGYLLLAYHPLTDAELDAYIAFGETKAGKALNRGLFEGFGKAYEDISYALGRTVALNMMAEEL